MPLEMYHEKRLFGKKIEPKGEEKTTETTGRIYFIQKHDASHLHYDLRLERDSVLKSGAPKKPAVQKEMRRLIMMVGDHPIEYANFAGEISKGEYGAGTVEIGIRVHTRLRIKVKARSSST